MARNSSDSSSASGEPSLTAADRDAYGNLLDECQSALGYTFRNQAFLKQALTHSSIARTRSDSNERMEFLGDAIMGTSICEYLYNEFPEHAEGELTRIKSAVVSRHTCARLSSQLQISRYLLLGKGLASHDRIPSSILAGVFEALVAAIYLDGGWEPARDFVLNCLRSEVERVGRSSHGQNFKSQLQHLAQKLLGQTPVYRLLDEKGPDHSKCFQVAAAVGSRLFESGWGPSKKEAEQNAAKNALDQLHRESGGRPLPAQTVAEKPARLLPDDEDDSSDELDEASDNEALDDEDEAWERAVWSDDVVDFDSEEDDFGTFG